MNRNNRPSVTAWERTKWTAKRETAKIAKRNDANACTPHQGHHSRNKDCFAHKDAACNLSTFAVFLALASIWPLTYRAIALFFFFFFHDFNHGGNSLYPLQHKVMQKRKNKTKPCANLSHFVLAAAAELHRPTVWNGGERSPRTPSMQKQPSVVEGMGVVGCFFFLFVLLLREEALGMYCKIYKV